MLKLNIEDGVYKISFFKTKRINTLIANPFKDELIKFVSVPGREVVLSMSGINFIDSSGFNAMMAIINHANLKGCRFRLSDVSQEVYELLNLMKFSLVLEINPSITRTFSEVL